MSWLRGRDGLLMEASMPVAARKLHPIPVPGSMRLARAWGAVALLLATAIGIYLHTVDAPFVFDDEAAVLRNPTIRDLGSFDVLRPPADGSTTTGRPLVNLSLAINYALSGEQVWSYHLVNLALHAGCALLLFGLVRRLVAAARVAFAASADAVALLAALLWAAHPLQTETVVSTAQRTESLCAFFYLLTFYAFARAVRLGEGAHATEGSANRRWLTLSVGACLAGMASKEVMVTAPVLVLLFDRTFVGGSFASAWRQRRPYYVALACTWLLLAALIMDAGGSRGTAAGFGQGVSSWHYLLTQAEALGLYLKLTVWPHPLILDYGTSVRTSVADVWLSGLFVVGLLAGTIWALVRRPVLGFLGAAFFIVLSPSSSVVPLVTQTIAEHRMYLPLAPLMVLVAVLAARWRAGVYLLVLLVAALAATTIARNRDYQDLVTLWADNVAKAPHVARGHNNLAMALLRREDVSAADEAFARAVAVNPAYVSARYNWGAALLEQGRIDGALRELGEAVRLKPDHLDARVNLGVALVRGGRAAEALPHLEAALAVQPSADIHHNLGAAQLQLGRGEEAVQQFTTALKQDPALVESRFQLGLALERVGRLADAVGEWEELVRQAPRHAGARRKLGLIAAQSADFPTAERHLRVATEVVPDDAATHANLGNVLLLKGDPVGALRCYQRALELRPDDARLLESVKVAREEMR